MNPRPNLQVVTGEIPADGPQSMAEALEHIRLLNGELERLGDELEGETRARRAAKGEATRYRRLLEAKRKKEEEQDPVVRRILENWRDLCAVCPSQIKIVEGSPRWERIVARLNEGWTEEELLLVPVGSLGFEWHNGSHPETKGKKYHGVETIYRDSDQVEKLLGMARQKQDRDLDERLAAWMAEHSPDMARALEQERHIETLVDLEPTAFDPLPSEDPGPEVPPIERWA